MYDIYIFHNNPVLTLLTTRMIALSWRGARAS